MATTKSTKSVTGRKALGARKAVSGRRAVAARIARGARKATPIARTNRRTAAATPATARHTAAVAPASRRTLAPVVETVAPTVSRTSRRAAGEPVAPPLPRVPSTEEVRRLATTIAGTLRGLPAESWDRVIELARTEAQHQRKADSAVRRAA
jgi:hypothetical protein